MKSIYWRSSKDLAESPLKEGWKRCAEGKRWREGGVEEGT